MITLHFHLQRQYKYELFHMYTSRDLHFHSQICIIVELGALCYAGKKNPSGTNAALTCYLNT